MIDLEAHKARYEKILAFLYELLEEETLSQIPPDEVEKHKTLTNNRIDLIKDVLATFEEK